MFECSTLYTENLNATEDIIINQGGTYSGKTYSINQVLFSKAISEQGRIITTVGESIPNLKKGAMRDAETIIASSPQLRQLIASQNKSDRTYTFSSGSIQEFTSYTTSQDAHSGKRDYLFLNEAPGISWAIAEQLINRTNIRVFIDYNPSIPFWVHEKLIRPGKFGNKKVRLIISDHRHNPFLTQDQHDHIEMRAIEDPEWGKVYARGLTGKVEGLIIRNWKFCDSIPEGAKHLGYALDFGYTNDVTALIDVYLADGELWVDELIYETGLLNVPIAGVEHQQKNISDQMKELKVKRVVIDADSAEQKSIGELKAAGWMMNDVKKPPGSVLASIDILKRYKINITRRSVNIAKEFNTVKWKVDKVTGANLNEPVDWCNHAFDALRYKALARLPKNNSGKYHVY